MYLSGDASKKGRITIKTRVLTVFILILAVKVSIELNNYRLLLQVG